MRLQLCDPFAWARSVSPMFLPALSGIASPGVSDTPFQDTKGLRNCELNFDLNKPKCLRDDKAQSVYPLEAAVKRLFRRPSEVEHAMTNQRLYRAPPRPLDKAPAP
jgi:hypothetical protein